MRQLSRLWQLQGQLQLGAALQGAKQAPAMAHLSTPVSFGQPPAFTPPSGYTAVPLDRTYMPQGGEHLRPSILFLNLDSHFQLATARALHQKLSPVHSNASYATS